VGSYATLMILTLKKDGIYKKMVLESNISPK